MPSSVSEALRVVRCMSRTPSLSSSLSMYELATAVDRFNACPSHADVVGRRDTHK